MVPCGIPYIFGSLDSSEQNVLPGDASYDTGPTFGVGDNPQMVRFADINQDGHMDLLTANTSSRDVSVLMGTGAHW